MPRYKVFLIALLLLLALVAVVVLLKRKTDASRPLLQERLSAAQHIIATPDTTLTETLPSDTVVKDSLAPLLPDSILSRDLRAPREAGYEDGYAQGAEDGSMHLDERAHFDDFSVFPSEVERLQYAKAYAQGYAEGFRDGRLGRQYAVREQADTLEAEEVPTEMEE